MSDAKDDRTPRERDDAMSAAAGRADLAAQLRQLEDFAAHTASAGEALPPQASEMIFHLREIVQALDSLTESLSEQAQGEADAPPADPPSSDPAPRS